MQSWPLTRSASDASTATRQSVPTLTASSSAWGCFTGTSWYRASRRARAPARNPRARMEESSAGRQWRRNQESDFLTDAGRITGPPGRKRLESGRYHTFRARDPAFAPAKRRWTPAKSSCFIRERIAHLVDADRAAAASSARQAEPAQVLTSERARECAPSSHRLAPVDGVERGGD